MNSKTYDIGIRLKKLRLSRDITQKRFGEMFGLAESTIGMYERDERKPDYETLIRIADYFEVSIDYLLGRDQHNEKIIRHEKHLGRDLLSDREYKFLIGVLKVFRESNKEVENINE